MANYPETEQTYQALINLKAVDKFASFNMIFEEVKRIRLSRNLKANPSNLKGRVRRSLTNDEKTFKVKNSPSLFVILSQAVGYGLNPLIKLKTVSVF